MLLLRGLAGGCRAAAVGDLRREARFSTQRMARRMIAVMGLETVFHAAGTWSACSPGQAGQAVGFAGWHSACAGQRVWAVGPWLVRGSSSSQACVEGCRSRPRFLFLVGTGQRAPDTGERERELGRKRKP
jgi:hypothetical protein